MQHEHANIPNRSGISISADPGSNRSQIWARLFFFLKTLPLPSLWQSHTHKAIGKNHTPSHHRQTIYSPPFSLCKWVCACACASVCVCGQTSEIGRAGWEVGGRMDAGSLCIYVHALHCDANTSGHRECIAAAHLHNRCSHAGNVISLMYGASGCKACSFESLDPIHTW